MIAVPVVLILVLKSVLCFTQYNLMKLNTGKLSQIAAANESDCFASCSANITAVSYSNYNNMCAASTCSNLLLSPGALWKTVICSETNNNNNNNCGNDMRPMFEWTLTDACGYVNTGWLNTGKSLQPSIYGSVKQWSPTYSIPVNNGDGNAIKFPNLPKYMVITPYMQIPLNMSLSLTLFAYFWLYAVPYSFPIFEFAYSDAWGNYAGNYAPHFWYHGGGLYFYFNYFGCSGTCSGTYYSFTPTLNRWTSVALVYDASESKFKKYLNGVNVWTSGYTTFTSTGTLNFVLAGSRSDYGQLPGSLYCMKIYQAALSASDIQNVASSCGQPKVQFQFH